MLHFAWRVMRSVPVRLQSKLALNMGWRSSMAMRRFRRERAAGREVYPAFLFVSVTTRCQLRCQGCWVAVDGAPVDMDPRLLDRILRDGKARGRHFYGILGGEPLLYAPLLDVLGRHPDCYFQVFTNGLSLDRDMALSMRRLGNVTPLISIEGLERTGDERRGGRDVFGRSLDGLRESVRAGLFTGVASSICRSNFDELVSENFIQAMIREGAHYLWYYIYRPSGLRPHPELALSREQVIALRRFLVEQRRRQPILLIDAYWDQDGRPLCPAAAGISHHVNPWGQVEPCPPLQFSKDTLNPDSDTAGTVAASSFLADFRDFAGTKTGGCILLDDPPALEDFIRAQGAADSSGRPVAAKPALPGACLCSHDLPECRIPEPRGFYRLAKKSWFFGFSAYG